MSFRDPLFIVSNGREQMKTIQHMDTSELFSLHEQLMSQLHTRFAAITARRQMILQTVLRVNLELQERLPGDRNLTNMRQKLRDQIAISNQIIRNQQGNGRKKLGRNVRRRKK